MHPLVQENAKDSTAGSGADVPKVLKLQFLSGEEFVFGHDSVIIE